MRTPPPSNPSPKARMLKRFNPYDLTDDQVIHQATGRDSQVQRLLRMIEDNASRAEPPNQHVLVQAPRGMGKSFLVRLIQIAVAETVATGKSIAFVMLPEEQLNVSAPELLLEEVQRVLEGRPADQVRVKWRAGGEAEWHHALNNLKNALRSCCPATHGNKCLLVISIENFDVLLESVFQDDEAAVSRLRDMLASEPEIMLLATSTRPVDAAYSERLFQAFKREPLRSWQPDDFVEYYKKTHGVDSSISTRQEAKVRALAHFMGGAPRLAVLMGEILRTNDALSAAQTLDQLVDELTPYYQDRILERLKPRARWLLDELLRGGEPCSQTELAVRVGAGGQNDISRPFGELQHDQIVTGEREKGGRATLYRITDRIFAHFYRRRYLAGEADSPLAAMLDFLEAFYTVEERAAQVLELTRVGQLNAARDMLKALHQAPGIWGTAGQTSRLRVCERILKLLSQVIDSQSHATISHDIAKLQELIHTGDISSSIKIVIESKIQYSKLLEKNLWLIAHSAILMTIPSDEDAIERLKSVQNISETSDDLESYAIASYALSTLYSFTAKADEGDIALEKAELAANKIKMVPLQALILEQRLWHFGMTSRFDELIDHFDAAYDVVNAIQDRSIRRFLRRP